MADTERTATTKHAYFESDDDDEDDLNSVLRPPRPTGKRPRLACSQESNSDIHDSPAPRNAEGAHPSNSQQQGRGGTSVDQAEAVVKNMSDSSPPPRAASAVPSAASAHGSNLHTHLQDDHHDASEENDPDRHTLDHAHVPVRERLRDDALSSGLPVRSASARPSAQRQQHPHHEERPEARAHLGASISSPGQHHSAHPPPPPPPAARRRMHLKLPVTASGISLAVTGAETVSGLLRTLNKLEPRAAVTCLQRLMSEVDGEDADDGDQDHDGHGGRRTTPVLHLDSHRAEGDDDLPFALAVPTMPASPARRSRDDTQEAPPAEHDGSNDLQQQQAGDNDENAVSPSDFWAVPTAIPILHVVIQQLPVKRAGVMVVRWVANSFVVEGHDHPFDKWAQARQWLMYIYAFKFRDLDFVRLALGDLVQGIEIQTWESAVAVAQQGAAMMCVQYEKLYSGIQHMAECMEKQQALFREALSSETTLPADRAAAERELQDMYTSFRQQHKRLDRFFELAQHGGESSL